MAISTMDCANVSSVARKRTLLFILNEPTYFISHRLPIAIAARDEGYDVHVATGVLLPPKKMLDEGFVYHALPLSRSGRNVFSELHSLYAIYRLLKTLKPDMLHLVTIKPVIYGSLAARFAKVPAVVAAVSGLGYAFMEQYWEARLLRKIISQLYRHGFKHKNLKVIFQNEDDRTTIINLGAIKKEQSILVRGSGVDLVHYQYRPEPNTIVPTVVMAARLLRDKGVFEYIEAAKLLHAKGIKARFCLAGEVDPGNPSSVDTYQLHTWIENREIEYLGYQEDIPGLFSEANIVVLPSYREGLPRVLSEAAACGRAIVTTDVPGCRAAIIPGETGLLSKVKDSLSLADTIEALLKDKCLRHHMGRMGRLFAEQAFDINYIIKQHLEIYQELRHALKI